MKSISVFSSALLVLLLSSFSVQASTEYELSAIGKDENAALGNLKSKKLTETIQKSLSKEELKQFAKPIRTNILLKVDDFVQTKDVSYSSENDKIKASGKVIVDDEKITAVLASITSADKSKAQMPNENTTPAGTEPVKEAQIDKSAVESNPEQKIESVAKDTAESSSDKGKASAASGGELFLAVMNNDESALKKLLSSGTDVNEKNAEGQSALIAAARKNSVSMINLLLEAKADVNSEDNSKSTALIYAIKDHYSDLDQAVISALLKAKADPNHTDINGLSAVSYAIGANNLPLLRELIRKGGNLKAGASAKVGDEIIRDHIMNSTDPNLYKMKAFFTTEL